MRAVLAIAVLLLPLVAALEAQEKETAKNQTINRILEVVRMPGNTRVIGATVEAWGAPGGTIVRYTGPDGFARFEGVPRKGVVFVARHPGHRCGWHEPGRWRWNMPEEDEDPDGDGVTRMKLVLDAGTVVTGRVLTKDGKPIAGAVVEAREQAHATDLWTLRGAPLWTATTDAEGLFRTDRHWPKPTRKDRKLVSAEVTARARHRIHEMTEVWPGNAGKQEPLEFRLLAAGEIRGVVIGADGEPASRALVHAYPPDHWAFAPEGSDRRDTTETHPREMHVTADAEGNYSLPEAFPGVKYRIFAEVIRPDADGVLLSDDILARSAVTEGVGVPAAGATVVVDLRVVLLGSLTVRFAPEVDGEADRSRIELIPPSDARPWSYDREKEGGAVTVARADPGEWTIEADAAGWLPSRTVVTVEAGKAKTVEIRLERGVAVSGIVVDDDGTPVAGATIYGYSVDPEDPDRFLDGREEATTGADGRFRLQGLRPGPAKIHAGHDRLQDDGYAPVTAPAEDVRIVLHSRASLRFRVLPAEGVSDPDRVRVTVTRLDGRNRGTQGQYEVERKDGAFLVENLMPGRVSFAVEATGHAPYITRLTIRPGVRNEPEPFQLTVGITVRGRVVDGSGRGVAGARILAWGNEENAAVTAADGTFALPNMVPGIVDLSVKAAGMAEVLLTPRIAAGGPPLTITVRPGGLVRGTIRDRTGSSPVVSIDIFPASAKTDNVSRWRVAVADDGAFSVRLPAGRYRCSYRKASEKRGPAVFDVEEGAEVVLELAYP